MQTVLRILKAGRRLAPRPAPQDRKPALYGFGHRGDRRVRPMRSCPLSLSAHYGEQNGDAMRDPEMCFELGFAGRAHTSNPSIGATITLALSSGAASSATATTATTPQLHERARTLRQAVGQATCDSRASPMPSSGSATNTR